MKYNPIKCWIVNDEIFESAVITSSPPDFQILKKSVLKRGFRGFLIDSRDTIENSQWYKDFLRGQGVKINLDGSGVYQIVNLDFSENEIYFERLNIPIGYQPWVFYCWQSDLPKANTLIQSVLEQVIDDINRTRNPNQPLVLKNAPDLAVAGAGNIVDEMKTNIDQSLIFVADLTNTSIVTTEQGETKEKWHPNSNVVFEMSYALVRKMNEQVILLKKVRDENNENKTPFDIYQNRANFFSTEDELRQKLKTVMVKSLEGISYIIPLAGS